jgi:Transglutaminase-like superfamily
VFGTRRLYNFFHLPRQKRRLFLKAFFWLTLVRLGLRFLSFQQLCKQMRSRRRILRDENRSAKVSLRQIIWAVQASGKYTPGGAKCLAKALTTQKLMLSHGYVPELKIGVGKSSAGEFEAHAWIEYEGQVVMGALDNLAQFKPLPPLKEPSR